MYYIGLDVHKRKISYCVKDPSGAIHSEGWIPATRFDLDRWMRTLPQPWSAAMEATMFTGWIYDHLKPHAAALKVAHPLMLRAIALAKKKNDRIDANKICDCLRCDFLPECYMVSTAIRERRRTLRYRNLLVRQITALTWALEIGEVQRFSSLKKAVSYCGLCGAQQSSADHVQRTPLSKQRNKHLQTTLIEAAKMAPRYSPTLALLYDREKQKGNANRATLAVARKLVAYLLAVDRSQTHFLVVDRETCAAA
jgi:transposase